MYSTTEDSTSIIPGHESLRKSLYPTLQVGVLLDGHGLTITLGAHALLFIHLVLFVRKTTTRYLTRYSHHAILPFGSGTRCWSHWFGCDGRIDHRRRWFMRPLYSRRGSTEKARCNQAVGPERKRRVKYSAGWLGLLLCKEPP